MLKRGILLAAFILLASCTPSAQEIVDADYGSYPDNYKAIVLKYMQSALVDPDSAKYVWGGPPSHGWIMDTAFSSPVYGYRVCADINARNRMGGYAGSQLYYFLLHTDHIVSVRTEDTTSLRQLMQICGMSVPQ